MLDLKQKVYDDCKRRERGMVKELSDAQDQVILTKHTYDNLVARARKGGRRKRAIQEAWRQHHSMKRELRIMFATNSKLQETITRLKQELDADLSAHGHWSWK